MRRLILAVGFLGYFSTMASAAGHDCRIKPTIGFSIVKLASGNIRLTALYKAVTDNATLSNATCPDQVPPQGWDTDTPILGFADDLGYQVQWGVGTLAEGVTHVAETGAFHGIETLEFIFGRACFTVTDGTPHFVTCPASVAAHTFTPRYAPPRVRR